MNIFQHLYISNNSQPILGRDRTTPTIFNFKGTSYGLGKLEYPTYPTGVFVDKSGNIFISEDWNGYVSSWAPNATTGTLAAGHYNYGTSGGGTDSMHLEAPSDVFVDAHGGIYISDYSNNRVQKWVYVIYAQTLTLITDSVGVYTATVTYANGCVVTSNSLTFTKNNKVTNISSSLCSAGGSYTFQGTAYKAAGIYSAHFVDKAGCDSALFLTLTDKRSDTTFINKTLCNGQSYTINGHTYTANGIYSAKYTNKAGCDSIVSLKLNVSTIKIIDLGKGCKGDSLMVVAPGTTKITWKRNGKVIKQYTPFPIGEGNRYRFQVAGQPGAHTGSDNAHLNWPQGLFLDNKNNLTICDANNNRVQKWVQKAANGITVAGQNNGTSGFDSTHLNYPCGIAPDSAGDLYIADQNNHRVQKWVKGVNYGKTVAGQTAKHGSDSASLYYPAGIFLDKKRNLYIADVYNNRVQKWAAGAKFGITVAGDKNGVSGADSARLNGPNAIYVDTAGNIYIADSRNNRIQKWAAGAKYGTTVAGDKAGKSGTDTAHLNGPTDVHLNGAGVLYIADYGNNRILKWVPGATYGTTIVAQYVGGYGNFQYGNFFCMDANGVIYADDDYSAITRWTQTADTFYLRTDSAGYYTATVSFYSGCSDTTSASVYIDASYTTVNGILCDGKYYAFNGNNYTLPGTYMAHLSNKKGCDSAITLNLTVNPSNYKLVDASICRGQAYTFHGKTYTSTGQYTVRFTNTYGCDSTFVLNLTLSAAALAYSGHACIADTLKLNVSGASKIVWKKGTRILKTLIADSFRRGKIVAGRTKSTAYGIYDTAHLYSPLTCVVDLNENIYTIDNAAGWGDKRIMKWFPYNKYGNVIANNLPEYTGRFFINKESDLYYSDAFYGNVVYIWKHWATKRGAVVAGDPKYSSGKDSAHLYYPDGVSVDSTGNVYVADEINNRIQKWASGAKYGVTVAGSGNCVSGNDSAHLKSPCDVIVDSAGNVYALDRNNNRVQKWVPGAKYGVTVAGQKDGTSGSDSAHLWFPYGFYVDKQGNVYVADRNNYRIQLWKPGAKYGITVAAHKPGTLYNDSNYMNQPFNVFVDKKGNIYVTDGYNGWISKWPAFNPIPTGTYNYKVDSSGTYSVTVSYLNGCADTTINAYIHPGSASVVNKDICMGNTYSFNGLTYSSSGVLFQHLSNSAGCDSFITLNLNVHPKYYFKYASICPGTSFNFNSTAYKVSGTYKAALKDKLGCDSMETLHLTVNNDTLIDGGHSCAGDTLKLTVNNANKIVIKRGSRIIKTINSNPHYYGVTVAGQKNGTSGWDSVHLNNPQGVYVDDTGNIFIANPYEDDIIKWPNGAKYGTIIAGVQSSYGTDSTHFATPRSVWGDASGSIYVSDFSNNRVQKWNKGGKFGLTVAGFKNGKSGYDSTHLAGPNGVYVDATGNIFVADENNQRIEKWMPGFKYGIKVAGTGIGNFGSDSTRLYNPAGVFVDHHSNIYIADFSNNRVQKWAPGAKYGVTVAGQRNGTGGADSAHLNNPNAVFVDDSDNIFVADVYNHRIQKWVPGAKYGITVAGQANGTRGSDSTQLNYPSDVYVDHLGNIYIADAGNNRIQKWSQNFTGTYTFIADSTGTYTAIVTSTGGCTHTSNSVIITKPNNVYITKDSTCPGSAYSFQGHSYSIAGNYTVKYTNKYGCDSTYNLSLSLKPGGTYSYRTSICGGQSYAFHGHTYSSSGVYTEKFTNKLGCDSNFTLYLTKDTAMLSHGSKTCLGDTLKLNVTGASKIVWKRGSKVIDTVVPSIYLKTLDGITNITGTDSVHLNEPYGVFKDAAGNVYMADEINHRIQMLTADGKHIYTVAGQSNATGGSDSSHLSYPTDVKVDGFGNIFIADYGNNRVQKWAPGAKFGTTVAGRVNGKSGNDSTQLNGPIYLFVDSVDNVYISDYWNDRVIKWASGAKYGKIVAGKKSGYCTDSTCVFRPKGVFADKSGNVYVVNEVKNNVVKWAPGATYGITVVGQQNGSSTGSGGYKNHLYLPQGIWLDSRNNIFVASNFSIIGEWGAGSKFGKVVAGDTCCRGGYNYLNSPEGIFVDDEGNIYEADFWSNRVLKIAKSLNGAYSIVADTPGLYTAIVTYTNGCATQTDTITVNNLKGSHNTTSTSVCLGKSYVFNGKTYSATGVYSDTFKNKTGCDSVVALNLTVKPAISNIINASVCPGLSYKFNGKSYTTAGTYRDTLLNKAGCDSINTLNLSVKSTSSSSISKGICAGSSYTFNGKSYSNAGVYKDTLTNKVSCDSFVTLTLSLKAKSSSAFKAAFCIGSSYTFNGKTYTSGGTYNDTFKNKAGCDSVVTLTLTANAKNSKTVNASICKGSSYTFDGKSLTSPGTYYDSLKNKAGCDSVITLNLTTNAKSSSSVSASFCAGSSYNFNGKKLTSSGTYLDTLKNKAGCDSVIKLTLTANNKSSSTIKASFCLGSVYMFHGKGFSSTGTYVDTIKNKAGCDSVVTLNLSAIGSTSKTLNDTIKKGKPVTVNGKIYSKPGNYTDTLFYKSSHCDSVILRIHVVYATGVNNIAATRTSINIYPNPNDGQFTIDISSDNHAEKAHIQVVNLLGQVVKEQWAENINGQIHTTLSCKNLSASVYLVKVKMGNESYVNRVVVESK